MVRPLRCLSACIRTTDVPNTSNIAVVGTSGTQRKEQIGGADPLLGRWALQLIEDQLIMLPEFVETSFECFER
jgi:hypothetical protein